jgi:signal transduction histidine kinase
VSTLALDSSLEHLVVLELATAYDVASGMAGVAALVLEACEADAVEWWTPEDGDAPRGGQHIALGRAGALVVVGGCVDPELEAVLAPLAAILRRRRAEERLARSVATLARRNEALEDYAGLVAHELRNPLLAAREAADPAEQIEHALLLVESLLDAARDDAGESPLAECLDGAVRELASEGVEITADLAGTLPVPPGPLRVILRNLLGNAVAAGAGHIHVSADQGPGWWRLLVDDDGAGLGRPDRYAAGSGIGLALCRRIAARFGSALELGPCPLGGTRAMLEAAR